MPMRTPIAFQVCPYLVPGAREHLQHPFEGWPIEGVKLLRRKKTRFVSGNEDGIALEGVRCAEGEISHLLNQPVARSYNLVWLAEGIHDDPGQSPHCVRQRIKGSNKGTCHGLGGIPHSSSSRIARLRMICTNWAWAKPAFRNAIYERGSARPLYSPNMRGSHRVSMKSTGSSIKRSYSSAFMYSCSTNWNWSSGGRSFPGNL